MPELLLVEELDVVLPVEELVAVAPPVLVVVAPVVLVAVAPPVLVVVAGLEPPGPDEVGASR
jgi:hypothetical protein